MAYVNVRGMEICWPHWRHIFLGQQIDTICGKLLYNYEHPSVESYRNKVILQSNLEERSEFLKKEQQKVLRKRLSESSIDSGVRDSS